MKTSPFFDVGYGWPYGSDGWNTRMDENLLVLSFLNTNRVNSIVSTLPPSPSEGDSYILSLDNSARFYADGTWRIVYPDDGWSFTTFNGDEWVYQGGVPTLKPNTVDLSGSLSVLSSRVDSVDTRLSSAEGELEGLGDIPTRVLELEETRASQQELDDLSVTTSLLQGEVMVLTDQMGVATDKVTNLEDGLIIAQQGLGDKLESVAAGNGVNVDNTDPTNPVVSLDTSVLSGVATSGQYSDLSGTPTLGTAASQDASAFDPSGSAGAVETSLTSLINGRMSAAARAAIDALDPATATLSDLITALQS